MKSKTILGLCLSGSLLFAGQAALADKGKEKSNNRSEQAVQVHIDKETGRKVAEDDSAAATSAAAVRATPLANDQMDLLMPEQSESVVTHADGTISARVGQEHLKFLAVRIDESGEKVFTHQTSEVPEKISETTAAEEGLE